MRNEAPYRPIRCDVHDTLEAAATRRSITRIVFLDEAGLRQQRDTVIADLVTRSDGEYMQLETGESVRLDRIISVDGVHPADAPLDDPAQ